MSPSPVNHSTATSFTKEPSSSPLDLPYLPDELLLNCFARVSRFLYPTLSLVSKRFRSLLASLELYNTRKLLSRTESCLYVCLWFGEPYWFTLYRRSTHLNPNSNPKSQWSTPCFKQFRNIMSSDNLLVSVPTRNLPPHFFGALTTIGSNIYMICGDTNGEPSPKVFFMDCLSHTWHEAPNMLTAGKWPQVSVLDGKIYVVKGGKICSSSSLIEVFDPKTETWEHVPSPGPEIHGTYIKDSLVINGNLYLLGDKNVVYKPKENRWYALGYQRCDALAGSDMCWAAINGSSCEIDEVTYCHRSIRKVLEWYDNEERSWKVLKGLEGLPKLWIGFRFRLVNYGGKIAVLWEENEGGISFKKMIWLAVIALERRGKHEIYGKIEWCDVVLTVPKTCSFKKMIAVTV
ncbi:hypothetical protein EUTSA_v10009365mg [Eutrema salsugineum]|uniref:F-box domain-containing protein n=1 Tax=Eutrema salsugineum TaxID=72664 RepID=V4KQQ0_EUTSA|nr:putative F-box/kelch-repeat protein At4g11770 [Eutrema salsugineum]ESQ33599.1 hypothetical protein EUTSA_v10009365mg [Eutrema salsugineum]